MPVPEEFAPSQKNIDRFFALSLDMLCIVGFDGYLKLTNPAFEKTLGYPPPDLLTQPLLALVHPDDHTATTTALHQLTPETPSSSFETRLRHHDGTYRHYEWTATYDTAGIYAVVRPVHAAVVGELAFVTLHNWLLDAPAGIIVLRGREHEIVLANALYEHISGHTEAQLVGRKLRDVFPEIIEQGVGTILDQIYVTGKGFAAQEFYAAFDHSGKGFLEEGYYNFAAEPIKDSSGQVTDLFVHVYEITEYVVAREKLKESETHFRAIFNQSAVGIAEADLTGRLIFVNDRFCEMVGYSREELVGLRMHEITHPDDLPYNAMLFDRMVKEGINFDIEKRYVRKNGTFIWARNSVSVIRDVNGVIKYALSVMFDITEIKAAETALAEHQREQAVEGERQRLARELHDSVTQTLFSASILTEAIPRMLESQPAKALGELENLNTLIRGASSEMRTLLWELRPDKIITSGLAALLTQLAYAVQARKPLKVWLRIHGDKEVLLPPDVLMVFYRIAQESINNIIKHSEASRVKVMMRRTETYVMMAVVDDGNGFEASHLRPGFGLTIMQERAVEIGADLKIISAIGKGTRIRLFWKDPTKTADVIALPEP